VDGSIVGDQLGEGGRRVNVPQGAGGVDRGSDEEVGRVVGPGKGREWGDLVEWDFALDAQRPWC
jgi:hypothetical protein